MTDVTTPHVIKVLNTDITDYVQAHTVEIEQSLSSEGETTASARFRVDNAAALGLAELQPVLIYDPDTGVRFFSGRIQSLEDKSSGLSLDYDVECVDYSWDMAHPAALDTTTSTSANDSSIIQTMMATCCPSIECSTFVDTVYASIPNFETERNTPADVVGKLAQIAGANWYVDYGPSNAPRASASELVTNGGFETAGGGGADVFGSWSESAGDGSITDDTGAPYAGTHDCLLTAGASANTYVTQNITVVPYNYYRLTMRVMGDGTNAGRYRVYDVSNSVNILDTTSTGATSATAYSYLPYFFYAPSGCTSVQIRLICPTANGGHAHFDSVSLQVCYNANLHYFPSTGEVADELLSNTGFETVAGSDFGDWTEVASDGAVADEGTIVHAGSHAAKLTAGAGVNTNIYQNRTVISGRAMTFSFWTRVAAGESTALRYRIYDLTNGENIVAITSSGVTGEAYTQVSVDFTVPNDCNSVRLFFYSPATNTMSAYVDDVSLKYDFGAPYTLGDTPDPTNWTNYTKLTRTKTAPEANRVTVYGSGSIAETRTTGAEGDYGGWLSTSLVDSNITTAAQAQEYGDNLLARLALTTSYSCSVYRPGLFAGMTILLTNAARGLSDESLVIYRVTTRFEGGGYARYDLEMGKSVRRLSEILAKAVGGSRGGVGGLSAAYQELVNTYEEQLTAYEAHTHTLSITGYTHRHGIAGETTLATTASHTHGLTGDHAHEVSMGSLETGAASAGTAHTHTFYGVNASGTGGMTGSTMAAGSGGASHTHGIGQVAAYVYTYDDSAHTHPSSVSGAPYVAP